MKDEAYPYESGRSDEKSTENVNMDVRARALVLVEVCRRDRLLKLAFDILARERDWDRLPTRKRMIVNTDC